MRIGAALGALAFVAAASGCQATPRASAGTAGSPVELSGLAAASLTEALTHAADVFLATTHDTRVSFSFEGSQQVAAHVNQGAPVDLAATASAADMASLEHAGLVESATTFATNRLEILVAPGNPKHVATLSDLARPDLSVVLAAPEVPAGKYAAQALDRAGVSVHPKSLELDVKSAVRRVTFGDADAAIVYVTDVRAAGSKAAGVEIPDAQNVTATYRIAVVKTSTRKTQARSFIVSLLRGRGRRALLDQGFATP